MRKSIFAKSLYVDTLKRLILPSSVLALVVAASSVITIISVALESETANIYTLLTMSPMLSTVAITWAPAATLFAYSYLTKRASADFYDSLPITRVQTVVSVSLAIITVLFATVMVNTAVSLITCLIFSDVCVISWGASISAFFAVLVGTLFAVATFTLAASITGTTVSAALVGFLIAAGPRIVMALINMAVAEYAPMLVPGKIIPLFDNNYNLYTALAVSNTEAITGIAAFIYTVILTLLYAALAILAYHLRKSENSTIPAPNALLRHAYGIALATVVASLGIYTSFAWGFDVTSVIAFFFAIVVYYLYELLTVKRIKAFASATVCLPILIGVVGFAAGFTGIAAYAYSSYSPDADDIKYVSLVPDSEKFYIPFDSYVSALSGEIELDDSNLCEIVADSLQDNVDAFKDGSYYRKYNGVDAEYTQLTVKIKSGILGAYRTIYVPDSEYAYIVEKLGESEWYKSLWTDLPDTPNSVSVEYESLVFDKESSETVYKALCDEIAEFGYEKWISVYENYHSGPRVTFNIDVNGTPTDVYIDVPEALVKTTSAIESHMDVAMQKQIDNAFTALEESKNDSENIYIYMYVETGEYHGSISGYADELYAEGDADELISFIKSCVTNKYVSYESYEPCVDLQINSYSGGYYYYSVRCKLSDALNIDVIRSFMEKYDIYN